MRIINSTVWQATNGETLLTYEPGKRTAYVDGGILKAEHLMELASACQEAAEMIRGAAAKEVQKAVR